MPPPGHLPLQVPQFVTILAHAHQRLKSQLVVATNMLGRHTTQLAQASWEYGFEGLWES